VSILDGVELLCGSDKAIQTAAEVIPFTYQALLEGYSWLFKVIKSIDEEHVLCVNI